MLKLKKNNYLCTCNKLIYPHIKYDHYILSNLNFSPDTLIYLLSNFWNIPVNWQISNLTSNILLPEKSNLEEKTWVSLLFINVNWMHFCYTFIESRYCNVLNTVQQHNCSVPACSISSLSLQYSKHKPDINHFYVCNITSTETICNVLCLILDTFLAIYCKSPGIFESLGDLD